jgi:hypothetical protein
MGVPKLWQFVSQTKLGLRKTFPYRSNSNNSSHDQLQLDNHHLIFDGPSFAYWFWREAGVNQGFISLNKDCIEMIDQYFQFVQLVTEFIQRLLENGTFKLYGIV